MNDPIERQDAIDAIFSEPLYESGMKKRDADEVVPAIYEKIKALPSAQQEIVRCKDCKNRYIDCPMHHVEWVEYDDDGYIDVDDIVYDYTVDDGFCYKGIRHGFD